MLGEQEQYENNHQANDGWFDRKVSLGNIVTVIVFVFTMGITYSDVQAKSEYNKVAIQDDQLDIAQIKSDYVRKDVESQQIEVLIQKIDELNHRIERLENRLR